MTQGNKAKARSTCSAGSLSSMLSSETDEDSLSAGASNSQNSSVGGGGSGSIGGDKGGGQLSHTAARHKIAIKPKKNHGRSRPMRGHPPTSSEPSLPATPEERATTNDALHSHAHDEGGANNAMDTSGGLLSNSNSAELLATDLSGGGSSAVSSRPLSAIDDEALVGSPSTPGLSRGGAPSPGVVVCPPVGAEHGGPSADRRHSSANFGVDETPEPMAAATDGQEVSPKRRPAGGIAMINVQAIQEALSVSGSSAAVNGGSPVQRSKSMKMESTHSSSNTGDAALLRGLATSGGAESAGGILHSPVVLRRALRPVSQQLVLGSASLDPSEQQLLPGPSPTHVQQQLSAQNSPVKRGNSSASSAILNVSSDFFQRSKSFSAKVSETYQALGEFSFFTRLCQ